MTELNFLPTSQDLSFMPHSAKGSLMPPEPPMELGQGGGEHALWQRICLGDMAAFEVFYKNYYPRLGRFILRTLRQPDHVEELVQETLMVVWEKPQQFNQHSKLSTWVFGIAYHKVLKCLAQNKRFENIPDDEMYHQMPDPNANPAQGHEIQDWLDSALATLSPEQRAVVQLAFYHELAYQDIAVILDCPENTVKTRMFHARKKLQAFAQNQGK